MENSKSVVCYGKSGCVKRDKRKQGCESGGGQGPGVEGRDPMDGRRLSPPRNLETAGWQQASLGRVGC